MNRKFLKELANVCDVQVSTMSIVEWAEANRVVTSGSQFLGKWSYDLTPYMKEPVNRLSPFDPTRNVVIMGGSQLGKSHNYIFNAIGYYISQHPCNMFFTCGDETLVKGAMEKVDEMIASSGLRDYIRPTVLKRKNQKSGDTDSEKQFVGGVLKAQSIKAVNKIKQDSFKVIFLDDAENANQITAKNVGNVIELAKARATSFGDSYKLSVIGVPELKQTSIVEPAYLKGDQRKYFLPCPCCGDYIEIVWRKKIEGSEDLYAGIHYETENGLLIEKSVGYICQSCGGFFKETHKTDMLAAGDWRPTAVAKEKYYHSYHLPALLAPKGFFGWTQYAQQWLNCYPSAGVVNEKELQHFINHVLAQTYEIRKKEISAQKIARNIRDYEIKVIPEHISKNDGKGKICLLTFACDINGLEDDARVDYEILAHTQDGTTYSIDAGSIGTYQSGLPKENRELWSLKHGVNLSVWDEVRRLISTQYYTDENEPITIAIAGIDTGYFANYVYKFLDDGVTGCIVLGLKGDPKERERRIDKDSKTFKLATQRPDLYLVQGNMIKDMLCDFMKKEYEYGEKMPENFMNYPQPSNGKYTTLYFEQYESEERRPVLNSSGLEVSFAWDKISGKQNHFFDCRVYNLCLRDIFIHIVSKAAKQPITWVEYCQLINK